MTYNPGMGAYRASFDNDINLGNFAQFNHLCGVGVDVKQFPPGVAAAPFVYKDESDGSEYDMKFMGGVACIVQDPHTLALRPELA